MFIDIHADFDTMISAIYDFVMCYLDAYEIEKDIVSCHAYYFTFSHIETILGVMVNDFDFEHVN